MQLETNASRKAMRGLLYQQVIQINLQLVAHYLHKMLPVERNWETYYIELLAIVKVFENWCHVFEKTSLTILVFKNHNNQMKFMETERLLKAFAL